MQNPGWIGVITFPLLYEQIVWGLVDFACFESCCSFLPDFTLLQLPTREFINIAVLAASARLIDGDLGERFVNLSYRND